MRSGIQQELFAQVVELLMQRGLILKRGTIVDSTFIEAPSSPRATKTNCKNEYYVCFGKLDFS